MLPNLIGFTIIMSITPGPNNIICLTLGTRYGYKTAAKYISGVVLGCYSMMWLMLMLSDFTTDKVPLITKYIGWFGAAYILYLAYKIIRSGGLKVDETEIANGERSDKESKDSSKRVMGLKEGILIQYVNPKAYIFNMTVVTGFFSNAGLNVLQYSLIIVMMGIIFFSCCSVWALFGHSFRKVFARYGRQINWALGAVLVYVAVNIVLH